MRKCIMYMHVFMVAHTLHNSMAQLPYIMYVVTIIVVVANAVRKLTDYRNYIGTSKLNL